MRGIKMVQHGGQFKILKSYENAKDLLGDRRLLLMVRQIGISSCDFSSSFPQVDVMICICPAMLQPSHIWIAEEGYKVSPDSQHRLLISILHH